MHFACAAFDVNPSHLLLHRPWRTGEGLPIVATDDSGEWWMVGIPGDRVAVFLGDFDQGFVEGVCGLGLPTLRGDAAAFDGLHFDLAAARSALGATPGCP